ncbi:AraC family transcriptional regulator [Flavobacterium selenitireducens]|uniref:AraC family transcriptional regulator n=1 Tax=Flavobacterium selenitireducens TaxID=2722704 RepID=UPI00168B479D|nr:helix-turn-helix domain-containing protein [Flavobacterium selenitireducens]MBD3581308.1 AraC family transcriptional regulator [Flavobacterium selenitireducens]
MQILPSIPLRPYIKHYLFIDSVEALNMTLRIFADGNTGIVFCMDSLLRDNNEIIPSSFLYGPITDYRTFNTMGRLSLVIVVFRPYGLSSLFNIPANTIKNKLIDCTLVMGTAATSLHDELHFAKSHGQAASILDTYFSRLACQSKANLHPVVSASTEWILRQKGQFSSNELSDHVGCKQRSLERAFNEVVGLSPKKLGGIIRLHYFLGKSRTTKDFTPVAYDAGYFDQAHLIREFKKITGITPGAYHKNDSLAVNVVSLPDENVQLFDTIPS